MNNLVIKLIKSILTINFLVLLLFQTCFWQFFKREYFLVIVTLSTLINNSNTNFVKSFLVSFI